MAKIGIIEYEKLVDGTKLMYNNTNLTSVKCPFPALKNGKWMFRGCSFLKTFEVTDLSKLENGYQMFYVDNTTEENTFTTFSVNLPNLKYAYYMFGRAKNPFEVYGDGTDAQSTYPALKTFEGDLSNLIDARWMFRDSSIRYFYPTSKLSKLKCGYNMFQHAFLKPESYKKLSEVLPKITESMTPEKLNDDSEWEYPVVGEPDGKKLIPPEMRGRLGLQCRRLEDEELLEVQQYLDIITDNGWIVDRNGGDVQNGNEYAEYNIPFSYSKKVRIGIHKKITNGYTELYDEEYTFSGTRLQGQMGQVYFSRSMNSERPYANIIPTKGYKENENVVVDVCLDDGTCNTTDITVGFDEGKCEVTFTLSFVKSQLSVNYKNVKISGGTYRVYIGSSQVYPT